MEEVGAFQTIDKIEECVVQFCMREGHSREKGEESHQCHLKRCQG